nr:hypothetical protein HK105_002787 [Polyrhizophydium stewartii]
MIYMFVTAPKSFENPTGRIILTICGIDLLDCGVSSVLCQAQATGIEFSNLSSSLLGLALALNALYIVVIRGSAQLIRKFELVIILVCLAIPAPLALVPLFVQPTPGVRMYGDADQWCWIVKAYGPFQIYFWFAWLWSIVIFNMLSFILVRYSLLANDAVLATNESSQSRTNKTRNYIIARMLAYLTAFVIIWTPSSVNRVVQMSIGSPVFGLSVWQSIFSPLRGALNFLAYLYAWRNHPEAALRGRTTTDSDSVGGTSTTKAISTSGPANTRIRVIKSSSIGTSCTKK